MSGMWDDLLEAYPASIDEEFVAIHNHLQSDPDKMIDSFPGDSHKRLLERNYWNDVAPAMRHYRFIISENAPVIWAIDSAMIELKRARSLILGYEEDEDE